MPGWLVLEGRCVEPGELELLYAYGSLPEVGVWPVKDTNGGSCNERGTETRLSIDDLWLSPLEKEVP